MGEESMSKLSRTKGANFELRTIKMLKNELGDVLPDAENMRRNLSQYQSADGCDVVVGDLFALEMKHYKTGNWYAESWFEQSKHSAALLNMIPVLVWKYDRQPIRVTMPMYAVNRDYALNSDDHDFPRDGNAMEPLTMTFETACMIMREWLV
jgi:hypothetical protein